PGTASSFVPAELYDSAAARLDPESPHEPGSTLSFVPAELHDSAAARLIYYLRRTESPSRQQHDLAKHFAGGEVFVRCARVLQMKGAIYDRLELAGENVLQDIV